MPLFVYVGGGFGYDGLHNILEAAVYGKPVIFGPEYEKNFEAVEMIEGDAAISIENAIELEKILDKLLSDEAEIKMRGEAAKNYVYSKAGATKKNYGVYSRKTPSYQLIKLFYNRISIQPAYLNF